MGDRSRRSARPRAPSTTLAGAIAVVTGASTGIGRAIALALAHAGADIAITYYREERRARTVARAIERLGRRAEVFHLDLSDPASVSGLTRAVRRSFNRADIWVNNGGADILTGPWAERSDLEKLDLLLAVDLRGTILTSWEAARLMRRQPGGGVIINMSWDHVLVGMAGRNPEMFSAAKGGVLAFSKSLARSVAPAVRVNVLAPGWIATDFADELERKRHRAVARGTPLGRWGTPADVARAALFLASPDAAFLTGQTLLVGGGIVM